MAPSLDLNRSRAGHDTSGNAFDFLGFATLIRGIQALRLSMIDSRAERREREQMASRLEAQLVQAVQNHSQDSADWHGLSASHVWSLWTRYACTAFYSHPWAWNEIGFGGPAYPRGYKARHVGGRERWEVADHDEADPVPFADRVERARQQHADLVERKEQQ